MAPRCPALYIHVPDPWGEWVRVSSAPEDGFGFTSVLLINGPEPSNSSLPAEECASVPSKHSHNVAKRQILVPTNAG